MALSIATQVRPPQEPGLGQANPMAIMNDMFKLRMNMQEYGARQAFGQTLATAPDTDSAIKSWQQNPMAGFFPEGLTQLRANQLLESQLQTQGLERQRIGTALAGQRITNLMDVNKQSLLNSPTPEALEKNTSDLLQLLPPEDQQAGRQFLKDRNTGILGNLPPPGDPDRQNRYNLNTHGLMVANGMTSDEVYRSRGFLPPGVEVGPYGPGGAQQATPAFGYPGVQPGGGIMPGGSVPPPQPLSLGQTTPAATPAPAARPAGPAVPTGITPEQKQIQETRGTELGGYKTALENSIDTGQSLMAGINEYRQAMSAFVTKPGASSWKAMADLASKYGATPAEVNRIAGGDLSAAQEIEKLAAQQSMQQASQQLPHGSRLNQREWDTYISSNPGLDTLPGAANKIFDFWTRMYAKNRMELDALNKYQAKGGDMEGWRGEWAAQQGRRGLLSTRYTSGDGKTFIPTQAVIDLLNNKESAADFDSHFGKGSSAKFLGED